jgi:S1-C subfamily serine protease
MIQTNIHDDFFTRRRAEFGPGLSQLDTVERFFQPTGDEYGTISVGSKSVVVINGVKYRKVIYEITNTHYLKSVETDEYYYTVQKNRPYVISIRWTNDPNQTFVASLRSLLPNISYGVGAESSVYADARSGSKGKISSTSVGTSANIPQQLSDKVALGVAAKNQPAVVRIGANSCATLRFLLPNKKVFMKVDDACSPVVGSGSIVSSDGYISTNGHVVRQTPISLFLTTLAVDSANGNDDLVVRYIQYLVAGGVMSRDQVITLIDAANNGDSEALSKLTYAAESIPARNLEVSNRFNEYAVQLSHDPIRISQSGHKFRFKYSSTVVRAKYIDSNYDPFAETEGKFDISRSTTSDVAILKSEGTDYPIVRMGSVDDISKGDLVVAIGFPGFVDDGLLTKLRYTVPTITEGHVQGMAYDSPQRLRKLIASDTPIAEGNSGGPALTEGGLMAGLNTYGNSTCQSGDCFSDYSVFRDIADYKTLLKKNGIAIDTASDLSDRWSKAVDQFASGDYRAAARSLKDAQRAYPALYLADNLISQADKQVQAEDRARALKLVIAGLLALLVTGMIFGYWFLRKLRRQRQQQASVISVS